MGIKLIVYFVVVFLGVGSVAYAKPNLLGRNRALSVGQAKEADCGASSAIEH